MTNKIFLMGLGVALLSSTTAYAATSCTTMPTCDSLGYKTAASSCKSGVLPLVCPFDTSKVYCPDCSDYPLSSYDPDAGTYEKCQYADRYKYTACNSGWKLNNTTKNCDENACSSYGDNEAPAHCTKSPATCQKGKKTLYKCPACNQGYKLGASGSCESYQPLDVIYGGRGYDPLGVVYSVRDGYVKIVAIEDVDVQNWDSAMTSDVCYSLGHLSGLNTAGNYNYCVITSTAFSSDHSNTKTIWDAITSACDAVNHDSTWGKVMNYEPDYSTTASGGATAFTKGNWMVPTIYDLMTIHNAMTYGEGKVAITINDVLKQIGKTPLSSSKYYWSLNGYSPDCSHIDSVTENGDHGTTAWYLKDGSMSHATLGSGHVGSTVRPVLYLPIID